MFPAMPDRRELMTSQATNYLFRRLNTFQKLRPARVRRNKEKYVKKISDNQNS